MSDRFSAAERAGVFTKTDDEPLDDAACTEREEGLRRAAAKVGLRVSDLELFLRNGFTLETVPKINSVNRRSILSYLKKRETVPPKWLMICGLWPELKFDEGQRRARVRALYKATVLLIRRALARRDADPLKAERSVFWDPTAEVCRDLEMAPSALSALCKEFAGHSLSQVIDCVKAEGIRKRLRAELKAFLVKRVSRVGNGDAHGATLATETDAEEDENKWVIWKALKAERKWPEFSQSTWAMGLGFATYRRLYRACLAEFGKTPHQIEMEIIEELLTGGLGRQDDGVGCDAGTLTLDGAEDEVKGIEWYLDE
jgi:AraC-like DNA-binding protein